MVRYWKINPEKKTVEELTGAPDMAISTWIANQICLDFEYLQQWPVLEGLVYYGPELHDDSFFLIGRTLIKGLSIYKGEFRPHVTWSKE